MDYDPRTYFALNTIMVSRVAWSWAHGYYTPKGWPAYYIRKVVPCKHCKLDHCDSFLVGVMNLYGTPGQTLA